MKIVAVLYPGGEVAKRHQKLFRFGRKRTWPDRFSRKTRAMNLLY